MIHGALEAAMAGEPYDPMTLRPSTSSPCWRGRKGHGHQIVDREIRVVNKAEGFAGTADVLFRYGQRGIGILDYKTRKTSPTEEVVGLRQPGDAAGRLRRDLLGPENIDRVLAANVFISTTEPGRMEVVKHEDLARDWQAFRMVAALWRYQKGYDPRQQAPA
jgi:hypothetical protein